MNMWADAFDDLNDIDRKRDELSVDQLLKIAEVKALLAIGQELSSIHQHGINPEFMST